MENIDSVLFCIVFTITIVSYLTQIFKIVKNKSSDGVSLQAYIITFIALIVMTINTDSDKVYILAIVESILASIGIIVIYFYSKEFEKSSKDFFIAFICSFFMIHGVMQGIKSFKHNGFSTVSISSYTLWILLDCIIIYFESDKNVIIALIITILIYLYIIIDTMIKNINKNDLELISK